MAHTNISEQFSTAMLILACINDLADSELRDAVGILKKHPTATRQARAFAENAYTSSNDVMKRMHRFLKGKGVEQLYLDYMDKRQEQLAHHVSVLRLSIKQAADDVKDDNARFIADCCLASTLLQVADNVYTSLVRALRAQRIDATRVWRGMSMHEPAKFYQAALRRIKISSDNRTVASLEKSERLDMAVKAFNNALFSQEEMKAAEEYAQQINIEDNK